MKLFIQMLIVSIFLSGCSGLGGSLAASLLTGGGPNVNGQIGQTNQQGINVTVPSRNAPQVSLKPKSRVDNLDQSTKVINNVNIPPWVLLVIMVLSAGGIVGWVDNIVRFFIRIRKWRKERN